MKHIRNILLITFLVVAGLSVLLADASTILTTNSSDTLTTFRTNSNQNFNVLNSEKLQLAGDIGGTTGTPRLDLTGTEATGTLAYYIDGLWKTLSIGTANQILAASGTDLVPKWITSPYLATSTGLTVSNFASPNISQWTNNSGYLTSAVTSSDTFVQGDMLYYTGSVWSRVAPNTSAVSRRFLSQASSAAPVWTNIPAAGSLSFYLQQVSSTNLSAYKRMNFATGTLVSSTITGVGAASTTIASWLTPSSTPNLTSIPEGIWSLDIETVKTTGNRNLTLYASVFRYSGGAETLLFDFPQSDVITQSDPANPEEVTLHSHQPQILVSSTDRIGFRLYGVTTGGSQATTYKVFYQGIALSRLNLPGNTVDATNFVPYIGATANVDLGSFSLTGLVKDVQGTKYLTSTVNVLGATFDNAGTVIASNASTSPIRVPFAGTFTSWFVISDLSCTAKFDVWKVANAIPTNVNRVAGTDLPNVSSSQYTSSSALTGWTTTFAAGDLFRIVVTSTPSACTRVNVGLNYIKQ